MRMLSPQDFIERTWDAESRAPGDLDLSRYDGVPYPCACGRMHILTGASELLREMDGDEPRVVLACPDLGHQAMTLVHLRNGFATRAMSELGSRSEGDPLDAPRLKTG